MRKENVTVVIGAAIAGIVAAIGGNSIFSFISTFYIAIFSLVFSIIVAAMTANILLFYFHLRRKHYSLERSIED